MSNNCSICDVQCIAKEKSDVTFGCPCDWCKKILCKSCSKMSSSEVRAYLLSTRVMLFFCASCLNKIDNCKSSTSNAESNFDLTNKFRSITDTIKTELQQISLQIEKKASNQINKLEDLLQSDLLQPILDQLNRVNVNLTDVLDHYTKNISNNKPSDSDTLATEDSNYAKLFKALNDKFEPHITTLHKEVAYCLQILRQPNSTANSNLSLSKTTMIAQKSNTHGASSHLPSQTHSSASNSQTVATSTLPIATTSGKPSTMNINQPDVSTPRTSIIVGSRKMTNSKITAADPKKTVQIRNLENNVQSSDLLEYLKQTFGPSNSFNVEELKVRSGDYSSFKIVIKSDLLPEVLNPINWPEGVEVREFTFRNQRNTFRSFNNPRRNAK